jgi:ribosomal-protein-alanine N-acetyltransferase
MFPKLATNRFALQEITADDQPFIFEGLSHPQVIPFYGVSYQTLEETKAQMDFYQEMQQNDTGTWWKIVTRTTNNKVGAIGYNNFNKQHNRAEIGYWLLPAFWKQGIIAEVLPVVLIYMFDSKKIHRAEALVETGNEASFKVLEQAGFKHEGIMRDCEVKNGNYISLSIYSLLETEYLKRSI